MSDKDIDRQIASYFGVDNQPEVREIPFESLSQRVALQLDGGGEIYVSIPFDSNTPKPDMEAIIEYARQHPKAKALLWFNGEVREL